MLEIILQNVSSISCFFWTVCKTTCVCLWVPVTLLDKILLFFSNYPICNSIYSFRWPICQSDPVKNDKNVLKGLWNGCAIAIFKLMHFLAGSFPQCLVYLLSQPGIPGVTLCSCTGSYAAAAAGSYAAAADRRVFFARWFLHNFLDFFQFW